MDFHLPFAPLPMRITLLRVSQGIPLLFHSKLASLVVEGCEGVKRHALVLWFSLSLSQDSVPGLGDGLHKHSAHPDAEQDLAGISPYVLCCVLSHVWLFVTPWSAACQAPLSMGFPGHEYWSGLPFPPPGIFPTQGLNPSLASPALAGSFFIASTTWEAFLPIGKYKYSYGMAPRGSMFLLFCALPPMQWISISTLSCFPCK